MFSLLGVLIAREEPLDFSFLSATDAVAIAGIGSALVSGMSMYAGVMQICKLKNIRQVSFPNIRENVQIKFEARTNSLLHLMGLLPYIFYPPVLVVIWVSVYKIL